MLEIWALLAALSKSSSALSLAFKTTRRSLAVETFGSAWVLGGLWDGGVISKCGKFPM